MDGGAAKGSAGLIYGRPSKRVPRTGPFAALSEIVRHKVELLEKDDWIDPRLEEAFLSVALPDDHPFAAYEGFEQNDANVIGCAFEREAFSLTIDHYNVERLAAVFLVARAGRRFPIHWYRGLFPVTLRFEGVREIHVVEDAEIGLYRKLRASLDGLSAVLWDVVALRCIGCESGLLRFHLEINTYRRIEIEPGHGIVPSANVFIECERVSVIENLRQSWVDAVGEESLHILDALQRRGAVQHWNVPDFERFVADQGSAHR